MGLLYALGLGVQRDPAVALVHQFFGALGGSMEARMTVGYRHLFGDGVPKLCEVAAKQYGEVAETVAKEIHTDFVIERHKLADSKASALDQVRAVATAAAAVVEPA